MSQGEPLNLHGQLPVLCGLVQVLTHAYSGKVLVSDNGLAELKKIVLGRS